MPEVTTAAPPEPPQPPAPGPVMTPDPAPEPGRKGSGAATAGIVLIAIGAVFLAGRFTPMFSWWNLWPFIIVIAGLVQALTPGKEGWSVAKLFDGFVTVAFGGVFLAITGGVVGWDVWARIIAFWPVLLIALGLELLGKSIHASWPKVLGSLSIIAALVYAVLVSAGSISDLAWDRAGGGVGTRPYSVSEPVGDVETAHLTLDAGVASVRVNADDRLVSVAGNGVDEPVVEVERSTTTADVAVRLGEDGDGVVVWPGGTNAEYDVGLSDDVVWSLRMNTGVAELVADLSQVPVSELDLRPGVASCDIKLGDVPAQTDEGRVDVRAGVSSVVVRVPEDAEARVEIESGLSGNSVGGDFVRLGGGVWETPGYADARSGGRPVWVLVVKSGVGSITIDTY